MLVFLPLALKAHHHPDAARTSEQPDFPSSRCSAFQASFVVPTVLWRLCASLPALFSTRVPASAAPTPAGLCPGGPEAPPSPASSSSRCGGSASAGPWRGHDCQQGAAGASPSPSLMLFCCQRGSMVLPSFSPYSPPAVKENRLRNFIPQKSCIRRWRKISAHLHSIPENKTITRFDQSQQFAFLRP